MRRNGALDDRPGVPNCNGLQSENRAETQQLLPSRAPYGPRATTVHAKLDEMRDCGFVFAFGRVRVQKRIGIRFLSGTITYDGSGVVTNWDDETGKHKNEEYIGAGSMSWEDEAFNFNPKVSFDGARYMRWESENFLTGATGAEVFYTVGNNGDNAGFPGEFSGAKNDANYPDTGDVTDNFGTTVSKTWTPSADLTKLHIYNALSETGKWEGRLDGSIVEDESVNTTSFGTTPSGHTYVGARHYAVLNADIPEVILYRRVLTDDERQRVGSYLALKYGITKEDSYIASDVVTKFWDAAANAAYNNNVAGIVRDDGSDLFQPKSKSVGEGAILTDGLPPGVTLKGFVPVYSFPGDKYALVWGHNDGDTEYEGTEIADTGMMVMNRKWKVEDNGVATAVRASAGFGQIDYSGPPTMLSAASPSP